jgi:hypothetical protein
MTDSKHKALSLQDIGKQQSYENVWAVNTTQGEDRGNVFFTVANAQGTREDNVILPITWVPINLTEQVTRDQLLGSASFRRALSIGYITIISEEDANRVLKSEAGAKEAARVQKEMIGRVTDGAKTGMGTEAEQKPAAVSNGETAAPEISIPVAMFVEAMDTGTDDEALNSYRTLGRLRLPEMRAVLRKAKELRYEHTGKQVAADIADAKAAEAENDTM